MLVPRQSKLLLHPFRKARPHPETNICHNLPRARQPLGKLLGKHNEPLPKVHRHLLPPRLGGHRPHQLSPPHHLPTARRAAHLGEQPARLRLELEAIQRAHQLRERSWLVHQRRQLPPAVTQVRIPPAPRLRGQLGTHPARVVAESAAAARAPRYETNRSSPWPPSTSAPGPESAPADTRRASPGPRAPSRAHASGARPRTPPHPRMWSKVGSPTRPSALSRNI